MKHKNRFKSLLFPPLAFRILLIPISLFLLVYSMIYIGSESAIAYASYVLSFYTLTVWCLMIPKFIDAFKNFKGRNRFIRKWKRDTRFRINISLYSTLSFNTVFGLFHLWLGFFHHSVWFYSLGAYYICLAFMRFGLVRYTSRFSPGEKMRTELKKYRATGWFFLLMNISISFIIFFMVYFGRTFLHHTVTAIALAAFAFSSLAIAIINMIKFRNYKSPVYFSSRAISFASSLVSVLTLESTMIAVFGADTMDKIKRTVLLSVSGGAVSILIIAMAVRMIVIGKKQLKKSEVKYE